MILDSETQRQNLLRLLDRVQITGAEAEVLVELKLAIRHAGISVPSPNPNGAAREPDRTAPASRPA